MLIEEASHDPEYPVLLIHDSGKIIGKFIDATQASKAARATTYWRTYDTTPKPRIPGDAGFVTWYAPGLHRNRMAWLEIDLWRVDGTVTCGFSELLDLIGDAEITVLDPRPSSEES